MEVLGLRIEAHVQELEKTARNSIPMWPHKTPQLFSARRCLLSSHVPMYEPGSMEGSKRRASQIGISHMEIILASSGEIDGHQRIKCEC